MVTQLLWQAGFDIPLRSESEIRDWYDSKYAANAAGTERRLTDGLCGA